MRVSIAALAAFGWIAVAAAQAQPVPDSSADKGKGTMGLPPSSNAGNNGIGTAGSINGNNGSASSTVAGTAHGVTPFHPADAAKGASGKMETDPTQGGDQKKQ